MKIEKMYNLTDIINTLGVTRRTLYNYINDGTIKAVKFGKEWKVPESEFKRFLLEGTSNK